MVGPRRCATLAAVLLLAAMPIAVIPEPARGAGTIEVWLGGLNIPIAIAFSPDGRLFYDERNTGSIRIIFESNKTVLGTPFYTLPNTNFAGERGLLGLALHPGFPAVPYVYAYQTYNDVANATVYNRIVRIQASGNVGTSMQVLLAMPPLSGATNHNGGVIAFGPDGKLYAVVGENANIALAQNQLSPMGKVLRMNDDGSTPTDNPFYGNAAWHPLIYTYGHRNMFGLTFHPSVPNIYVTENGPNCNDEVNLLAAGGNFGWGVTQTCTTPPPPPQNTNRDGPNPIPPIWWWGATICPTNAAIYGGPNFPSWRGDLFMGDCNTRRLHRLDLTGPNYDVVATDTTIWTAPSFIMDVEAGPDGAIWFTTPSTIYRLYDTAQPPVASFTANPPATAPGVNVTFDASGSSDPDGVIVSYDWDFGDGAIATGVTANHAYTPPGTYTVSLTVTDNETLTDSTTRPVLVGGPPTAEFTANPWAANAGVSVTFDGSASTDDGTIVAYDWDFGDGNTASGMIMNHAFAAPGVYDVTLTVTDNSSVNDSVVHPFWVNAPPTAAFTASPPTSYMNTPVQFDASGSSDDGVVLTYDWDFGDGTTGSGITVTHAYAAKQVYTVILLVTDEFGLNDTMTRSVLIANRPPVITATDPPFLAMIVQPGAARTFTVTATDPDGDVLTYTWRIDGFVAGQGTSFNFSRTELRTYRVNVTVSDGTLEDWHEWTVTVQTATGAGANDLVIASAFAVAVLLALLAIFLWRRKRGEPPP